MFVVAIIGLLAPSLSPISTRPSQHRGRRRTLLNRKSIDAAKVRWSVATTGHSMPRRRSRSCSGATPHRAQTQLSRRWCTINAVQERCTLQRGPSTRKTSLWNNDGGAFVINQQTIAALTSLAHRKSFRPASNGSRSCPNENSIVPVILIAGLSSLVVPALRPKRKLILVAAICWLPTRAITPQHH